MKLTNKNDFIQRFRETHKLQIKAYIKPEIKSEKVFTVGYDISPFAYCDIGSGASHSTNVCFS